MTKWPIGVFASIDAGFGVSLEIASELSIPTVQLHAPHGAGRTPQRAAQFLDQLQTYGLELTAVFGGFEGESYADIPTVETTVGLVPPATRAARLAEMKQISDFAVHLRCPVVALHLGFVPHDIQSGEYQSVVETTRDLCDHCRANEQNLHLETGQETARALLEFIGHVDRDNLFINFDPANMILYGTGEPNEALREVADYVRSVHCKDANWSDQPGETWGTEVPLGEGQVNVREYLDTLNEIGYAGPLTIEREIPREPERQKREIRHAVDLLNALKRDVLV